MKINKDKSHSHYWVEGCQLFESYRTIRSLNCRFIADVLWPDSERLSEQDMEQITNILNGIE